MHVLQPEDNFCSVEFHFVLIKDAVLAEVVVEVTAVHEVENKTKFVWRVKGVRHADNERTVLARRDETQHDALIQSQRLALLHLYPFLIQALHRIHLSSVGLTTAVNLSESATTDYSMYGEVVHAQLNIQLKILPLTETSEFVRVDKFVKDSTSKVGEYLLQIGFKEVLRQWFSVGSRHRGISSCNRCR